MQKTILSDCPADCNKLFRWHDISFHNKKLPLCKKNQTAVAGHRTVRKLRLASNMTLTMKQKTGAGKSDVKKAVKAAMLKRPPYQFKPTHKTLHTICSTFASCHNAPSPIHQPRMHVTVGGNGGKPFLKLKCE